MNLVKKTCQNFRSELEKKSAAQRYWLVSSVLAGPACTQYETDNTKEQKHKKREKAPQTVQKTNWGAKQNKNAYHYDELRISSLEQSTVRHTTYFVSHPWYSAAPTRSQERNSQKSQSDNKKKNKKLPARESPSIFFFPVTNLDPKHHGTAAARHQTG